MLGRLWVESFLDMYGHGQKEVSSSPVKMRPLCSGLGWNMTALTFLLWPLSFDTTCVGDRSTVDRG